jgi:hypothetical protein
MLTFLIIFILLAGAAAASLYLRRTNRPSEMLGAPGFDAAQEFKPLFAPSQEELRAAEAEKNRLQLKLNEQAAAGKREAEEAEIVRLRSLWAAEPTKALTITLLYAAAKSENEGIYLQACKEVLGTWRRGSVKDLSAHDLAQLIESHYWLIPADKRTPGASFLIKQEIAGLRLIAPQTNN